MLRFKRVFNIYIETCQDLGGAVRIIACGEEPIVIQKLYSITGTTQRVVSHRAWCR
jgi:hypothetical protein